MPQRPAQHRVLWHRAHAERERAADRQRGGATARGYDSDWQRLRARFLKHNPICTWPGCWADATDVDHVVSVRERPDLRLAWFNLRSPCHSHHSQRTARDQPGGFNRQGDGGRSV